MLDFVLPREPVYLSFEAGPYRMQMGLIARHPDELVVIDEHYPAEMAERRQLLAERHHDVFGAEPGSELARAETLARVADLLPRRHPEWFAREGAILHNRLTGESWNVESPERDPLEIAGLLVQEDFCLLRLSEAGPILTAAVLCFPSRWRLHEKLGRPLADIHGPVPLYAERLARPVDRLITTLKEGRMVERVNWSANDDPALFQPGGRHLRRARNPNVNAANAGETLYLRVERQTLSLLPASGTVLFGIRVHIYPMARIAADKEVAARLASAIRALPEEMRGYKSLAPFQTVLLEYLDARVGSASF
ncbi:MAG: DUF3445 domain-containing protein [Alphaproteobacteria bacterium]|nr:DUF3445 domain-containing protein [Alphaproteobacteria bacterium]